MERLRVGIVGTSAYAEGRHLSALAAHPRVELVAAGGLDAEHAQAVAARHGVGRVFTVSASVFMPLLPLSGMMA